MPRPALDEIHNLYRTVRPQIEQRVAEFLALGERGTEADLFAELAFCLFTPQSKARQCDRAVWELRRSGLMWSGSAPRIAAVLARRVRFHHTKARRLVAARRLLREKGGPVLREVIHLPDPADARAWLVENVEGLGWKEATHFLRNTGRSGDLAILDRHILRNLRALGVVRALPRTMTPRAYRRIETAMQRFAGRLGLPIVHLDLLLWFKETGEVFK
ncbi:MAG: N-glycosylase/DNA lyase [Candidatus Sumerlaeia bacterium]